jgi:hypothetical protein
MIPWLILAVTGLVAFLSAWTSVLVHRGAPAAIYWVVGACSILTWSAMVKYSPWTLLVSSMAWDIVYNVGFLVTIAVASGDPVSAKQWVGLLFFLVGIVLVNG